MPRPIFDKEQYELRGHLPEVFTEKQKETLNKVLSRVNGQLDWNAQLLGFNGDGYWGSRIPTTDGSYKWKGLPQTVSEKRAVQVGTFGVYDKDRAYEDRPAPFRRDEVRASADFIFHVFEKDGKVGLVPFGQPEDLLYAETPVLIAGGEYTFDGLIDASTTNDTNASLFVTQDLAQGITSVRVLDAAPSGIQIAIDGSDVKPFLFFVEEWNDISDWTSPQVLSQFLGVWGNKGNHISAHFLLDALDVHGFSEEEGLSLDDILSQLTITDLLDLVGLKPGPATPYVTDHYNFKVEDCDELYQPTVALDTKIVRLETQNLEQLLLENGEELSIDDGPCTNEIFVGLSLETDGPEVSTTITDNGTFEALITNPPVDFLDNGDYPSTATSTIEDVGIFNQGRAELFTETDDALTIDDRSLDQKECYQPPDAEFGICDTPNYVLTLRQYFDTEPNEIATDPGPETSIPIGCNGVQYLFPPTCFIDNAEYPAILGQFYLDGGDYDFPIIFTNSVGDGLYDRDPFSVCDGLPEDYERIIDFDDLVVDVAGEAGATLYTDTGIDNPIVIAASGTEADGYDGFTIAFDGLELSELTFEYEAKTTYGETRFPCVEWIFDPSLDNSTYFPIPAEAAWMGTDDGEYDRLIGSRAFAGQTDLDCVSGGVIDGFLSFDDGVFDEIVVPNCDYQTNIPPNCEKVDGGIYQLGINPLRPPLSNTECGAECGTLDGEIYIYGLDPNLGNALIDGGVADICTIYDNTEYDLIQPPEAAGCIAYDNESYSGDGPGLIECVIEDFGSFTQTGPYEETIDDGILNVSTITEIFILATESNLELTDEADDLIGIDPAIIIPATAPESCIPCEADSPIPPIVVDCTLDNGTIEAALPPADEVDGGFYDKDIDPFCVPCQDPTAPVYPCPVEPIRVRLDQLIFSSPAWRMRPSVTNSLHPLRIWKNRVLNVSDLDIDNAFVNPLIADENTGPDDVASYRQHVRLPVDYQRNGKFWNRAESVMANQAYFSRLLPPAYTKLPVSDVLPLLYDEVYDEPPQYFDDFATFYVEDYLISTTEKSDTFLQDGFEDAVLSFEAPDSSSPFTLSAIIDYDGYEARKLNPNGTRPGAYFKFGDRGESLTGFLETDIVTYKLRPTDSTEPQINDTPPLLIPNIEFPDDPDGASFTNYTVSYAYFVADLSGADDPVFDPQKFFCHREKIICKPEIDDESITTEDGFELLTEDFEGIVTPSPSKIVEVPFITRSRYLFHDDTIPSCADPIILPLPAPPPPERNIQGTATIASGQLSVVQCESSLISLVELKGLPEPLTYQWQVNQGFGWVNAFGSVYSGVNTDELTISGIPASFDGTQIRLKAMSGVVTPKEVYSNVLTLSVTPATISISQQPQNFAATSSPETASFFVSASTNDGGTLSYQWQQNEGSGWVNMVDGGIISGSTTNTVSILNATEALSNSEYRAIISSTGCSSTVTSGVAKLTFPDPAAQADYFVITYTFSDGKDLDTRTSMLAPASSGAVGWGQASVIGVPNFITFGGDNTGTGVESVLLDIPNFLANYPGESEITLDLRAMWYGNAGANPVVINVTSYAGGSMVKSGFTWNNPTATATYNSFTSVDKVITLGSQQATNPGERVATMTINFVNGTVTYGT